MLIKSVSQRSSVQTSLQEVAMEEKRPESEDGSDRSTGRKPSPSRKIRHKYNSTGEGSGGEQNQKVFEVKSTP
jgi:stress response protein SCP2